MVSLSSPPRCPACGRQAWSMAIERTGDRLYGVPGEFSVWRCESCGLLRVWPVPEDVTRFYPPDYYSYSPSPAPRRGLAHSLQTRARLTQLRLAWRAHSAGLRVPRAVTSFPLLRSQAFRELTRYAPASTKSVLDVGCGAGDFLVDARRLGLKVRGAEISDSAAAPARERGLDCAGSFAALAESGGHYDVIRLSDVLEHLADPIHALTVVARCLTPAGVMIIRVPNADGAIARICGPEWYQLDAPRHLWSFGPESLSLLLGQVGLKVSRLETVSQEWLLFSSLRNLLESRAVMKLPVEAKPEVLKLCARIGWALDSEGWGDTLLVIAEHKPQ